MSELLTGDAAVTVRGGPPGSTVGGLAGLATEVLWENRAELVAVLETFGTRTAAVDEVANSIAALRGARGELEAHRPRPTGGLGVFLPSNNVLYSYVLFGIIPLLYSSHITMRPSQRVAEQSRHIHRIITSAPEFKNELSIELVSLTQKQFVARCADSDVVVFNGRPANALAVGDKLPERTVFLAFGSGPNPVVVGAEADVRAVAGDVVRTRMYNSGQDCLCPDVVFAHDSVADDLLTAMSEAVADVPVGARADPTTVVAPLSYPDAVEQAAGYLAGHPGRTVRGGRVDTATGLVAPTVIDLPWDPDFCPPEFFSPVLCVMRYSTGEDVVRWLDSHTERRRGMYVSVYGEDAVREGRSGTSVLLRERTALDAENGNEPLGGYGPEASHVRVGRTVTARPLLLSAELGMKPDASAGDLDA
ncbi:aldehyde dehydrogenase family protein [Streptomyces prasinopilosus]|uniref:aldehyde dehydrogenase family protein n=1 Tax=Streptomyces prasinopilosus TaxID=67344 RepID=UPI0006EB7202|nr:aldehyde dehydrogenase family protein [Streptomyces prasinopilosus]